MKGWKFAPAAIALIIAILFAGSALGQFDDDDDDDPFEGMFDPENSEMEVVLEWDSLDRAELSISMEMDMGEYGVLFRGFLDTDGDGEIEEDEIQGLENLFGDEEDQEGGLLGLEILIDNETAETEVETGWTGLLGDTANDDPIGMFAKTTYTWDIDDELERHRITLRPYDYDDEEEEEWPDDDINWTDDDEWDDDNWTDDDDEGMPFNMTFVINFPKGWDIDLDTVEPEMMKQFIKDGNRIELTSDDFETIGEPEGDIITFEVKKGSEDSPLPLWIPLGAILITLISIGFLRRRNH